MSLNTTREDFVLEKKRIDTLISNLILNPNALFVPDAFLEAEKKKLAGRDFEVISLFPGENAIVLA